MTAVFSLFLIVGTAIPVSVSVYPNLEACQSAAKSVWTYHSRNSATVYTAFCVQSNIVKQGAASQEVVSVDRGRQ